MSKQGIAGALEGVLSFGAPHATASLVRGDGVLVSVGDTEHRFALASVTKLLSAYALLVASEEGTVHLEEPAGPPGATVAHLLAHASGLGPTGGEPLAPPGRRRIYSSAGYEVLAGHLEAASGLSFPDYLEEAVLSPLQMAGSKLVGKAGDGAVGSLRDLAFFAAELLAPRLIAKATLELATSVAFPGLAGVLPGFGRQDPCDWGLGFELRDHKSPHWSGSGNSASSYGHFGQSGTFLLVDPEADFALLVLTDRPFGSWAVSAWPALCDEVLAATLAAS